MQEVWRNVEGYEGSYQISNIGNLKSLKHGKEKILKPNLNTTKYYKIALSENNKIKSFLISRLVAIAFIPNPQNKRTVNHKKGIKTDNRATELEWMTYSENHKHAYRELSRVSHFLGVWNIKRRSKQVLKLDNEYNILKTYNSTHHVKIDGYDQGYISKVCNNIKSKAYGFYWIFAKDYK